MNVKDIQEIKLEDHWQSPGRYLEILHTLF